MGNIRVIVEEDIPWQSGERDPRSENNPKGVTTQYRFPIAVVEGWLRFGRLRYDPGHRVESHTHAVNQLWYLLSGEMTLGNQTHKAGTVVIIEAGTRHGPLIAGPEGFDALLFMDRDEKADQRAVGA